MKKILITLLLSVLICLGVVAAKNVYSCEIPIGNRGIKDMISQGDLSLLMIGSSTFRSNIDVTALDEKFDNKDYIIAYGGNQMVATTVQYDEILKRSSNKYDCIVFEFDPLLLTEDVKLSDSRVIWDLSLEGKIKLFNKIRESGSLTSSIAIEYFLTSGMDDLITYPVTERIYSGRYYKGAKNNYVESPGADILNNTTFDLSTLEVNEYQKKAMIELINHCHDNNQKFIFLESPHYYLLSNDETYLKYKQELISLLEDLKADYILAEDIDFDNSNPKYFEDMSHMSTAGKENFTREMLKHF